MSISSGGAVRRLLSMTVTAVLAAAGLWFHQTLEAPAAQASTTYTFTDPSFNTWTWSPPSDGVIEVTVRGGAGGDAPAMFSGNNSSTGGNGAEITVSRTVLATDGFSIRVYPGGSAGGNCGNLGGGGPSATIYVNNTDAVVAGGGGGGGCNGASSASSRTPGDGGNAGVPTGLGTFAGSDGSNADNADPINIVTGGGGGGTASGGSAGSGFNYGIPAACCDGGSGASFSTYPTQTGASGGGGTGVGGGGGGGRYGGGGGGGSGAQAGAGGGGGSSYVGPAPWTFMSASSSSASGGEIVIVFTAANDADLSNLQLSQGTLSPTFAAGTTAYTASVASSVTSLTVTPTASASGAAITVNGVSVTSGTASGAFLLSPGSNTITVIVTALDGTTTKTYTVTVTRATSSDADLSNLQVSSGSLSPTFSAAVTAYAVNLPSTASSITVTPTVSDVGATVTVDGVAVTSGNTSAPIALTQTSTVISVVVTATDSSTLTYTITIVLGSEDASNQMPPSWYQAYQRPTQDASCHEGWNPSWAQWPNDYTGGWTCERTIYWDLNETNWSEQPGFRFGNL